MSVVAVIVCYDPDLQVLRRTCDSLVAGGARVILVDNTDHSSLEASALFSDCDIVENGANLGVAAAQNIGIARALQRQARTVVLFDQDSEITPAFLAALVAPLRLGSPDVAAPVSRDARKGFEYPGIRLGRFGLPTKVYSDGRSSPYEVDVVLASGTAATAETFAKAGMMTEGLFIDYVDTEWCLRCRARGVPIRIVPAAVMSHSVGNRSVDAGISTVFVHGPARSYYQIRNCFHLFRLPDVPTGFALRELAVTLVHKVMLLLAVDAKRSYVAAYAAGIRDGWSGVTGPYPDR